MPCLKRVYRSFAFRAVLLTAVTTVTFAGCFGGCIPPISFSVNLLNNISLPPAIAILGVGTPFSLTTDLPNQICSLPTQAQLTEQINTYVPSFLTSFIKLDSITIDQVKFTASEGDFNDFTYMAMTLLATGMDLPLGSASSATGLGTEFTLVPTAQVDLLDFLLNHAAGDCVNAEISLTGKVPAGALTFSMAADITVNVSLGF